MLDSRKRNIVENMIEMIFAFKKLTINKPVNKLHTNKLVIIALHGKFYDRICNSRAIRLRQLHCINEMRNMRMK